MVRLLLRCLTVGASAVAATFAALAVNRVEGNFTQIWTDAYFWSALAATAVATFAAGSQARTTRAPTASTAPPLSEQSFMSVSTTDHGDAADSFEVTWVEGEPFSKYTNKIRVVLAYIASLATLASLLALGIMTLPWALQSSNELAPAVPALTFPGAGLIVFGLVWYKPYVFWHLVTPKRRIPWQLSVQADGIHLTTPDWQHLIEWDQVHKVSIAATPTKSIYSFSSLLVRLKSADSVPPFSQPAGWPYLNEGNSYWTFPYFQPVCVIGPTTVSQRIKLIAALARFGGDRFIRPPVFVAAPVG